MTRRRTLRFTLLRLGALLVMLGLALPASMPRSVAHAQSGTIMLRVESARAWVPSGLALHQAIPSYTWVIVKDDTGETAPSFASFACKAQSIGGDPAYPANCPWPSIKASPGGTAGEVVYQGNETQLNQSQGITLENGKYMISVLADGMDVPGCTPSATVSCHVDGFKIDGQWFTVNGNSQLVTVEAQPYPLPLLTVRMKVFQDTNANGEYDTGEPPLQGWEGHISDILGQVTTDWYGNPICTEYQHDTNGNIIFDSSGAPTILHTGGRCLSDADGVVTIPYLGPNRYSAQVIPPNGETWVQMTSLEGGLDWEIWAQEGWNGYEAEFVNQTEAFPFAMFGFVKPTSLAGHPDSPTNSHGTETGAIKGRAVGIRPYTPAAAGIPFGVEAGNGIAGPIDRPQVTLVSIDAGDVVVWQGRGNPDGTFDIKHVPDGAYLVSLVDQPENYLVESFETVVTNGQVTDMGVLDEFPWFSHVKGHVCDDQNRNGKCEPGERGLAGLHVQLLSRDNSLQDQGTADATTDANGYYDLPQVYPLGQWVVAQVYDERFYTVGVTYQTENQPSETTVMANGGFVDVSTFNLVGLQTRLDWALHRYETDPSLGPTNGGIVGTVWYAATRNEIDARFAVNEPYEAGIPNIPVHLYAPVPCDPAAPPPAGTACADTDTPVGTASYLMINNPLNPQNGAYVKGNELAAPYLTETWKRPVNCTARDVNGNQVVEQVLPPPTGGHDCLEAFLMSNQVGDNAQADTAGNTGNGQLVNGNYGFSKGCFITDSAGSVVFDDAGNPIPGNVGPDGACATGTLVELPPWDYIVEPGIPRNPITGKPLFEVEKEEDVNVFTGDAFVAPGETPVTPPTPVQPSGASPQPTPQVPPFLCTGPLHTVHIVDHRADAHYDPNNPATTSGVYNPGFLGAGGSPLEGQQKPLCTSRLITVQRGKSATPNFFYFTDTPLPGRIHGLITDDLNTSTNPKGLFYGEKAGIPNIPIGIYDFANRLVTTIHTDPNGVYEAILPSTSSYNCPLPAGPCPGVYRLIANDPGQPGRLNPDYNPQYRTLSVFQQVWPNLTLPSDLAPVPASYFVESPGTQTAHPPQCLLNNPNIGAPLVPELYAVSPNPYVNSTSSAAARTFTIRGNYFGSSPGQVTLDGIPLTITAWSHTQITARVENSGANAVPPGPHQLQITGGNGQKGVNGLTFHVLGAGYSPTILQVGPGKAYDPTAPIRNTGGYEHALQDALNDAQASAGNKLVVVYPGPQGLYNPFGAYFENIVVRSPVKLQGVGPGGGYSDGSSVAGSVIDGVGFGQDNARTTAWQTLVAGLFPGIVQPTTPPEFMPYGQVVTLVAQTNRPYTAGYRAAIDGFTIRGGDVADAPPNLNDNGGGSELALFEPLDPIFQGGVSQGGGIFAYAGTQYLQITNNIIKNNGGAYGGAIRLGTPYAGDNILDNIRIAYNQIVANGGSNLAGAVGIFAGADGYEVDHNEICGNFSAEYGGGVSHFGLNGVNPLTGAPNRIHDNRIYFNGSYDEGAGVIVAGELPIPPGNPGTNRQTAPGSLPPPPAGLSPGAGPVDVYNNVIQSNLSGDDGGGLRLLMDGNYPYNVDNNIIANNISTHEGGGVALDDAPNVRLFNNTIVKNITTATSVSSTGAPKAAGLSSINNSTLLQRTLPPGAPTFSNPLLFNNIFCDNRAGSWDGANIIGIGYTNVAGQTDPNPINYWDVGLDGVGLFQPTNSILQPQPPSNPGLDPAFYPTANGNQACPAALGSLLTSLYDTSLLAFPWRGDNHFVGNVIIAQDVPPSLMGDYHLASASTIANNAGATSRSGIFAPAIDIDGDYRPSSGGYEIGADEIAAPPPVLDAFNRANSASIGANWRGNLGGFYTINANQADVLNSGYAWWCGAAAGAPGACNNPASVFGPNQEAFLTFTKIVPSATEHNLLLKVNNLDASGTFGGGATTSLIEVQYNPTANRVRINTYCGASVPGCGATQQWRTRAVFNTIAFANGDRFSARAYASGTVNVYRNGLLIGSAVIPTSGANAWPAALMAGGGRIGVWFVRPGGFTPPNDARFDDFGGGSLP